LIGWGAHCDEKSIGGLWGSSEQKLHINQLELIAAYFALRIFAKEMQGGTVLLRIDNTTAMQYINRIGSIRHSNLHLRSRKIWEFCESKQI